MKLDLNKLNTERYEKSVKHIVSVIKIVNNCHSRMEYLLDNIQDEAISEIKLSLAKVVNTLESVSEEMYRHCEYFDYDSSVCFQIDDTCGKLGVAISYLYDDYHTALSYINEGLNLLGKILATLVVWDKDLTS